MFPGRGSSMSINSDFKGKRRQFSSAGVLDVSKESGGQSWNSGSELCHTEI